MLRRFTCLYVLAVLLCGAPAYAQTLAHPGWRGNGIASQAWWKHAGFVRLGPDATFAEALHTLQMMREAGLDSIILPDLQPAAGATLPFHERFGTEEELDQLLREASALRMHVLLTMPVSRISADDGEVRFWMSRGIAGFDVGTVSAGDLSVLRGTRSSMSRLPGERILMANTGDAASSRGPARRDPVALHEVEGAAGAGFISSYVWRAVEVSSLDVAASVPSGNVAFVFPAELLMQEGNAEKIHSLMSGRGRRRMPRSR